MRIVVIGAGLLGLTTAFFLRRHGAEVVVIERQSGVGLETSFANGGMLHASQASPWNEPGVLWDALKMLGREDSALLIRPRALPRMLGWAWSFVRNSSPRRYLVNVEKNARLADYSLSVLNEHLAELGPAFGRANEGTLKIYRTAQEIDSAAMIAERCRQWDVRYDVLGPAEVVRLEPALAPIGTQLAGGIHFPDDVSGDAHRFCREIARRAADEGVTFLLETEISEIIAEHGRFRAVVQNGEVTSADACVLAAGSYSTRLAAAVGVRLPVQPVKGYSITVPMADWPTPPRRPVIDEHFHAAVCPLGDRLRVAGTAEFAGFDAALRPSRIENLYELVRRVYPHGAALIDRRQSAHWAGFRPMSPDGVGIMSETPVAGLFVNTGHGHLGWTMAPGAGKLLADRIITGRTEIEAADYALDRFGR